MLTSKFDFCPALDLLLYSADRNNPFGWNDGGRSGRSESGAISETLFMIAIRNRKCHSAVAGARERFINYHRPAEQRRVLFYDRFSARSGRRGVLRHRRRRFGCGGESTRRIPLSPCRVRSKALSNFRSTGAANTGLRRLPLTSVTACTDTTAIVARVRRQRRVVFDVFDSRPAI